MAAFLTDEDFNQRVAEELRQLGHVILTLADLGLAQLGVGDADVLEVAKIEKCVVLTHNRLHFVRLHRQSSLHQGIVISSQTRDPALQARQIDEVMRSVHSLGGCLVRKIWRIGRSSQRCNNETRRGEEVGAARSWWMAAGDSGPTLTLCANADREKA